MIDGGTRRPHQPLQSRGAVARRREASNARCRCRTTCRSSPRPTSSSASARRSSTYHADRLNYAVVGTPNRLEYDQGFFVKNGDGSADVKPIAHLYKTQVYGMARHLGLPERRLRRDPDHRHLQPGAGPGRVLFRAALPADGSRAVGAQPRRARGRARRARSRSRRDAGASGVRGHRQQAPHHPLPASGSGADRRPVVGTRSAPDGRNLSPRADLRHPRAAMPRAIAIPCFDLARQSGPGSAHAREVRLVLRVLPVRRTAAVSVAAHAG